MMDRIDSLIYEIRDVQVMLDSDLAALFNVETKVFNQAVKRNSNRFPNGFRFQLNEAEYEEIKKAGSNSDTKALRSHFVTFDNETLRTQDVTIENKRGKHRKYLPYAFTEQGVAMLTGVIRSDIAVEMSIKIMTAFVEMRKLIASKTLLLNRIDSVETQQLVYQKENDEKFNQLFNALQGKNNIQKEGVFFDGQIYDAYSFIVDLIEKAEKELIIVDNYVDKSVLDMLSKKKKSVKARVLTHKKTKLLALDIEKFNQQYPTLKVDYTNKIHDRFLLIDKKELYHIGASLKDLGKKCFAFSRFENKELIANLLKLL